MCDRHGDIIQVIKTEENNTDRFPLGVVICCYEDNIPPGYKLIEKVEMETMNEDPPEIGFWETLKLIFGRKE